MKTLRRKVYMAAGHNTVSMGTGRKEFHPKKARPGLDDYIREARKGVLAPSAPTPSSFVDHLNVYDCSKVSDGASTIAIASAEGRRRAGFTRGDAVEVLAIGQVEADLTRPPEDPTRLETTRSAVEQALEAARIKASDLGTVETRDCFTMAGVMATDAIGRAAPGERPDYIFAGHTARDGRVPFNTTGGLIGWGHPTGATGVHQAVTIWEQLTGRADRNQISISPTRPYGLTVNMGGDDKTLVAIVYRRGE